MLQAILPRNISVTKQNTYSRRAGLITNFFTWCNRQDKNRFLWLGIALLAGIGTVVPLTLFAIMIGANSNFTLWVITCIVNVPVLVVNLAAQPAKITLPVLFFAWITDALIMIYCMVLFFQNL